MAVVDVYNTQAEKVSQIELRDEIFNIPVKSCVLHSVVIMQLANRRAGNASVKNRSDVTGSTRKLFKQKGTGRARRGDIKSPVLRGGGVVFGPKPRSYSFSIPKKVRRLALRMALSSKFQSDRLMVINQIELNQIKTKQVVEILQVLKMDQTLIITDCSMPELELSSRNLPNVKILHTDGLNVYDILKYNNLLVLEPSIPAIQGRLLK